MIAAITRAMHLVRFVARLQQSATSVPEGARSNFVYDSVRSAHVLPPPRPPPRPLTAPRLPLLHPHPFLPLCRPFSQPAEEL